MTETFRDDVDWTQPHLHFAGSVQTQPNHETHDVNPWPYVEFSQPSTSDFMDNLGSSRTTQSEINTSHVYTAVSGYSPTDPQMYGQTVVEIIQSDDINHVPSVRSTGSFADQGKPHKIVALDHMRSMQDTSSSDEQPQGALSTISSFRSPSHEAMNEVPSLQHGPVESQHSTGPSHSQIGVIYSTNEARKCRFECSVPRCGRTFNRANDFDRHYNGAHALQKTVYWCPETGCNRSDSAGNKPFPRSDKMMDHFRKVHGASNDALEV